jgi:aspartyl/asparaginyl-tRNA synthetase
VQSPQLGKQMAIAADMERVYEIGPVFRAENSNTHRHLTEFTGLDLEMAIEDHYHEVVDMLDGALRAIFHGLQTEYRREIETVRKLYPSEDLVFPEKTVRLHFADGVQMLRDAGWTDDGHEIDMYEDFSTRTEKKLGDLVKEKYGTDYYILGEHYPAFALVAHPIAFTDKFPASARPFYTMPDPDDPKRANACDFFIRGEEILSGGQRIHEATFLEQRMKECGINPDTMKDYVDGFRQGCPPHGGGGIGLERVVFLFLKLGNIRWGTMFPRDPRSFPKAEQDKLAKAVEESTSGLLGPTASTIEYEKQRNAGQKPPLPKMEDLIAAYGDSPNTSWLDPFWTVWHHEDTGACCGYAASCVCCPLVALC